MGGTRAQRRNASRGGGSGGAVGPGLPPMAAGQSSAPLGKEGAVPSAATVAALSTAAAAASGACGGGDGGGGDMALDTVGGLGREGLRLPPTSASSTLCHRSARAQSVDVGVLQTMTRLRDSESKRAGADQQAMGWAAGWPPRQDEGFGLAGEGSTLPPVESLMSGALSPPSLICRDSVSRKMVRCPSPGKAQTQCRRRSTRRALCAPRQSVPYSPLRFSLSMAALGCRAGNTHRSKAGAPARVRNSIGSSRGRYLADQSAPPSTTPTPIPVTHTITKRTTHHQAPEPSPPPPPPTAGTFRNHPSKKRRLPEPSSPPHAPPRWRSTRVSSCSPGRPLRPSPAWPIRRLSGGALRVAWRRVPPR